MHTRSLQRLASCSLATVFLACSDERPPLHVAWPEPALPFALLLEQRGDDLRLVAGPLGVPSEARFWSEVEGAALILVGLNTEQLAALHPRVDLSLGPESFSVNPSSESCERGRRISDQRRAFAFPVTGLEMRVLHGSAGEKELERIRATLSGWSIEAPIDAELCDTARGRVESFADDIQLLEPGVVIDGQARDPSIETDENIYFQWRSGDWISKDAVAVSTEHMLFWVERGVPLLDTLDRRLRYSDALPSSPDSGGWFGYAVQRSPLEEGILFVGLRALSPERAALLTIDTRAGRFEVVSSSVSQGRTIASMAFDAEGRFVVGGRSGALGVGTAQAGLMTWTKLPGEASSVDHIVSLESPEPAFLVATAGGSAYIVPWATPENARRVELPGDLVGVTNVSAVGAEERRYLLLRSNERPLVSRDGSTWLRDAFDVPPEAEGCAQVVDACGERGFAEIISMSGPLDDTGFVLSPRGCTAVFRYAPSHRCLSALSVPGFPAITREPELRWYGTRRRGDRAIAFGQPARLVEILPP